MKEAIKANSHAISDLMGVGYTLIEIAESGKCFRVRATGEGMPGVIAIGRMLPITFANAVGRAKQIKVDKSGI